MYTELAKSLIEAGRSFTTTVAKRIADNFADHETRIAALESETVQIPPGVIIELAAGGATPAGYLPCDGSAVSRSVYADLFAAIGTLHGAGNGTTTFNVPDRKGRAAMGSGSRSVGTLVGDETHTLTESEMAEHDHSITDSGHVHYLQPTNGATASSYTVYSQNTFGNTAEPATLSTATTGISINNAGSGNAHNNMMASAVTAPYIKT